MKSTIKLVLTTAVLSWSIGLRAQVPQMISYQGHVNVSGVAFTGTGQFKFALVDGTGATSYWSNDGTSSGGGQPTAAFSLPVANGLFSVMLGDTNLAGMSAAIPASVFNNAEVRLRLWFNDGTHGFQLLSPDQRIGSVGYAMQSASAANLSGTLAASQLSGTVSLTQLPAEVLTNSQAGVTLSGNFNGTFSGDGSGVTNLNGSAVQNGSIGSAQLTAGAAAANLQAGGQSAVPSGGMVLSSNVTDSNLINAGYIKLSTVQMSGPEYWTQGATSALSARSLHTAVWTGSAMIVWGGTGYSGNLNDGGVYNPAANSWTAVTTNGAPSARGGHTAVWTGSAMIVWGGSENGVPLNDGGVYNPAADSWTAVTTNGAPSARYGHTAVWTGSAMVVWGGYNGSAFFNGGHVYNPAADSWTAVTTSGAPLARSDHTAVWTGSAMVVWGGGNNSLDFNDGGVYHPAADSWTAVTTSGAPSAREGHTAVWTGSTMIVWGGYNAANTLDFNDGGVYDPAAKSWTAVTTGGAPSARAGHTAVWTGSAMIVWGGANYSGAALDGGGVYYPTANNWTATTPGGAPPAREYHTAVWTGSTLIVWGGNNGTSLLNDTFIYTPAGTQTLYVYQRR